MLARDQRRVMGLGEECRSGSEVHSSSRLITGDGDWSRWRLSGLPSADLSLSVIYLLEASR